jgi:hypothetical protein
LIADNLRQTNNKSQRQQRAWAGHVIGEDNLREYVGHGCLTVDELPVFFEQAFAHENQQDE